MEKDSTTGEPPPSDVLTFLIADVRGYTQFTVERGDEAAARLAAAFVALAGEVISGYGGTVLEVRGDEVLAVFVSPRQALRASVRLQTRLAEHVSADPSLPLRVGIGLDAGEAVRVDSGYRGAALNLAARLCSLAAAGEVLASDTVVNLARRVEGLHYSERGMVQLKGFTDPIRVIQVTHEAETAGGGSTASIETLVSAEPEAVDEERAPRQNLPIGGYLGSLPSGPLVGRDEEIGRIMPALDAVINGEGRLILLTGEPGAGKTRLAQEVTLRVRDEGFLVAAGSCYEPRQGVPYYPFLDALAAMYAAAPASIRSAVPTRWPYLGHLLPEAPLGTPPVGSDQEAQERVFRAASGFVRAVAEIVPVAIFLGDLHWSDASSLHLLQHLARTTRGHRVLLLATYRDTEVDRAGPLDTTLGEFSRQDLAEPVTVRRLDEEGTAAFIRETLTDEQVPAELAHILHDRTGGNPFFLHHVLRAMAEGGDQAYTNVQSLHRGITAMEVPESVRSVIGQRLSRLSDTTHESLRIASVLGQTFRFDDLQAMVERTEDELDEDIDETVKVGLIRDIGKDRYGFDHALTQQTLHAELPSRRRRRLHRAAGEAIEQLPEQQRDRRAAELAWHFLQGDNPERALPYVLLAGDQALAVSGFSEAIDRYLQAAEIAHDLDDPRSEADARERQAMVLGTVGKFNAAVEVLDWAAELYRAISDVECEARVVAEMGQLNYERGTVDDTIGRVQSMLELMEPRGPSVVLGRLYLAQAEYFRSKMQDSEVARSAERAVEVARAVGDERLLVAALRRAGAMRAAAGDSQEGIRLLQEAITVAAGSELLPSWPFPEQMLAETYWNIGELETSVAYYGRSLELAQRTENEDAMAYVHAVLGHTRYSQGDWKEARHEYEQALRLAPSEGDSWGSWFATIFLGELCTAEGRWEEADKLLTAAHLTASRTDHLHWQFYALQARAALDLMRGRPENVVSRFESLHQELDFGLLPATLGWALLESGRHKDAAEFASQLIDRLVTLNTRVVLPQVLELHGTAAARLGRWEDATRHFEDGLSHAESMGIPYDTARILYRFAVELDMEHTQDVDREHRLRRAKAIFEQLGAVPYIERSARALERLSDTAPEPHGRLRT